MDNFYKMIGTSEIAVDYDINRNKRTNKEKLEFIKEKYESQIRMIRNRKDIARYNNDQQKLEELNSQMEAISFAYEQLKASILEQEYGHKSDETKQQDNITRGFMKKTPFEVLNLLEESIQFRTDDENDKIIKGRVEQLLIYYEQQLESSNDFKKKLKIRTKILEIENAYEMIKTSDRRKEYANQEKKDQEEKQKAKNIEEKYSHVSEYKADFVNNKENAKDKSIKDKIIERQEKLSEECVFIDKDDRELRIRQTGRINFQNWTSVNNVFINEYEIKREINGEEKKDTVYINLDIQDFEMNLEINKKTGKLVDPDYYDCIANELLAEEAIEGSKYNGGFLGGIRRDKNGQYHITLADETLSHMEQEQMTAVMIMKEIEKKEKEENII